MKHRKSSPLPRLLAADGGRARAQLTLLRDPSRPGAVPAIVTLGNAAAVAAGTSALEPTRAADRRASLLTLQLSLDLFRPDPQGTLTADAVTTYRGRSTLVVGVEVRDETRRLVASLVATHLVSGSDARAHRAS